MATPSLNSRKLLKEHESSARALGWLEQAEWSLLPLRSRSFRLLKASGWGMDRRPFAAPSRLQKKTTGLKQMFQGHGHGLANPFQALAPFRRPTAGLSWPFRESPCFCSGNTDALLCTVYVSLRWHMSFAVLPPAFRGLQCPFREHDCLNISSQFLYWQ